MNLLMRDRVMGTYCSNCLGKKTIGNASMQGTCDFCGASDVELYEFSVLQQNLEFLLDIYIPDNEGLLLQERLRLDWRLFEKMSHEQASICLAELLGDEVSSKKYRIRNNRETDFASWDSLKDELKFRNRYFLTNKLSQTDFSNLLQLLIADENTLPSTWYRARKLSSDKSSFSSTEMGAPPCGKAQSGRANPVGISYLYLSTDIDTCIAEIRPQVEERVCIASFVLSQNLNLVDLREPRKQISPFVYEESEDNERLLANVPFLESLEKELSTPVLPDTKEIDYLPAQYVCEFIKNCGFDGVLYSSSLGEGTNLALFDTRKAKIQKVDSTYKVNNIRYEYS